MDLSKRVISFFLLVIFSPLFLALTVVIFLSSGPPIFFKQKRVGKNKAIFSIYKFRTMIKNAENIKEKYAHLNQASGPVFKIKEDPRFTRFGYFLSHTGLDELPQLFNIMKGEMTFVGPRPLPINEAKKIPLQYQKRFSILPGITSEWVIKGAHTLPFNKWMELDLWYIKHKSISVDICISFLTIILIVKMLSNYLFNKIIFKKLL